MEQLEILLILGLTILFVHTNAILQYEVRVKENDEISLRCMETRPNSGTIQWLREKSILTSGKIIYNYKNYLSVNTPGPEEWNLKITRITKTFTGDYTCRVRGGEILSNVSLIVETSPRIDESASTPKTEEFNELSNATLTCKASGEPVPTITWHRRSTTKTEIGIIGESLRIPSIPRYATDVYTCIATNIHGAVEHNMTVKVKFDPEVTVMNSTVQAKTGDEIIMACRIQAYPLLEAYWTNNENEKIKKNWKYTFIEKKEDGDIPVRYLILSIKENTSHIHDSGNYTCHAVGVRKVANASVELTL